MGLIELAWTFVIIIWRLAECGFPIIDDAVIIKNGTNHIITNTNLNIKIRCGRDAKTINDTINMINNVKCASREFNVIFQGDVNLDVSYRVDSGSIGRTNMAVNGYRVVIYNGSGDIIQTYKLKFSFENINRGRLPKNTMLLRCVSPIFERDQYYLYRCWPFVLNEPLSFISVAFRSIQDPKSNKIHWQITNGKSSRYIIKAINLNTKKCISNEYLVKGTVSSSSTRCKLAKIHWYSSNTIELIDLDPITTYKILVVPLDRQYFSSSITIRTSYGSSEDRCFADCIFKTIDGSIKYTGIRQVDEKGNSCDETCSTKHASDRVTCPINKIQYNCNIPFCSYLKPSMTRCPSVISNRYSTHINLYLSDHMKLEQIGFIVLLYENLKCQRGIVLTKGQHELSMSVKSFFISCQKIFNYHQIQYFIKLRDLSLKNDYTTFVIPIITKNTTGIVLKIVHNKNYEMETIKQMKKRDVNWYRQRVDLNYNAINRMKNRPEDDKDGEDSLELRAFYVSICVLLLFIVTASAVVITRFLFSLYHRCFQCMGVKKITAESSEALEQQSPENKKPHMISTDKIPYINIKDVKYSFILPRDSNIPSDSDITFIKTNDVAVIKDNVPLRISSEA